MTTIGQNLAAVIAQIEQAAKKCDRAPQEITLLAVSKTKPVNAIQEAIAAGQRQFGENYVQEGVEKIQYFAGLAQHPELEWHFIGPLQSNKSRLVAENFDWIHTVDREKIALRLSEQRPATKAPLNVLIQLNIDDEPTKSGLSENQLLDLAEIISRLPHLTLRGLMIIPAPESNHDEQLKVFKRAESLFLQMKQRYLSVDTLSMGMSGDMAAAIAAGSTMVRIGTAIFGQRDYGQH
jgi:pyridoxal phosphate enzyme (YggS family)